MSFPQRRLRRLRRTEALRRMVRESRLHPDDLIAPLFVKEGAESPIPITSLPGQMQHTRESLRKEVNELVHMGVPSVVLFGLPEHKDAEGSEAWNPDGIVQLAIQDLKDDHGDDLVVIADLCVCEYTTHGHCGILDHRGQPENDSTLELHEQIAVAQATAGADICAPSGMMDGQVFAIREALDDAGFDQVAIMAYAAKFATALYGPFRDAVDVTIEGGGNRCGYQQDVNNTREAMEEIREDIAEGADFVMVKPAMPYLDLIYRARQELDVPIAAYHVSGEYAMIHAAAQNGWLDLDEVAFEHVGSIKRAGADLILTYFSRLIAEGLQ
ncbi:MAG: porphobilinogen synthase [Actinomycetota bacterium]